MLIERVEDKKFLMTITEKEAVMIGDCSKVDFHRSRIIANHIGTNLLQYMIICSELPDHHQPALEVEF